MRVAIYYRSDGVYAGPFDAHTTPEGRTIANNTTFHVSGESEHGTAELRAWTPEVADRIEAQEIASRLKTYVDWRRVPAATLRKIVKLVGLKDNR